MASAAATAARCPFLRRKQERVRVFRATLSMSTTSAGKAGLALAGGALGLKRGSGGGRGGGERCWARVKLSRATARSPP